MNGKIIRKYKRKKRFPRAITCDKCRFKCSQQFSEDDRVRLCELYWSMDYKTQHRFLLSHLHKDPVRRHRPRKSDKPPRTYSSTCYLPLRSTKIQVCQKYFSATLRESMQVISQILRNLSLPEVQPRKKRKLRKLLVPN